jgi:diaminohydroxyphosphoribosylaminopyrimidine deaminase / 5-amino-6-(5-phosphoribosylamino)uracil reductase
VQDRSDDEKLLHHALELARRGMGLASPNPHVGAVIAARDGKIVGKGFYTYEGVKHAEILALEQAGKRARGATLYINLEPHAHQGRTPPCTDALIAAGIRRVVASMADPNPKIAGRGFEQLRAAGIQVEVGGLEQEARRLNEGFARYIRDGVPLVTLKAAMTLDGKIAPPPITGKRIKNKFSGSWITSEPARVHAHELRHQHDAILVGIGTILADNPLLTDRSGYARRRPLLRVVLDSHLRLPVDSRLVQDAARNKKNDVIVFCASADSPLLYEKREQLKKLGIRVEPVATKDSAGQLDLPAILRRLAQLEITTLLIEGGSMVNAGALAAGVVDKVFLYYAPKILGVAGSIPFTASGFGPTLQTTIIRNVRMHRFGEDVAMEGYLRDPYAD